MFQEVTAVSITGAFAFGLILVMLYVAIYYRSLGLQTWIGLLTFSALIYALVVFLGQGIGELVVLVPVVPSDVGKS